MFSEPCGFYDLDTADEFLINDDPLESERFDQLELETEHLDLLETVDPLKLETEHLDDIMFNDYAFGDENFDDDLLMNDYSW